MGGVGSAVASAATKTALLAATTATTGVKGAVDKDIFYSPDDVGAVRRNGGQPGNRAGVHRQGNGASGCRISPDAGPDRHRGLP